MIIMTVLSIMSCLAGQDATKGECRIDEYRYEASNIVEAAEDWEGCLSDRDRMQALYHSVECDQFDKDHPPIYLERAK